MENVLDKTIIAEIIKEVESYLSDMRDCLHSLKENSADKQIAKELHRLTHTIKGVSGMVQLHDLSNTAAVMEKALDNIAANIQSWSGQLINIMDETVQRIDDYCVSLKKGEVNGNEIYQRTLSAFEEISSSTLNGSPDTDDGTFGQPIFADFTDEEDTESSLDVFQQLLDGDSDEDHHGLFGGLDDDDGMDSADKQDSLFETAATTEEIGLKFDHEEDLPLAETASVDPELLDCFNEEAEEHLENIGWQLNSLSSSVSGPMTISNTLRERLHSVRRSVHTMKGAAAVIGIQPVADWGHEFEDFLDWLHDDSDKLSPEIVTAMLDGADILEKITVNPAVNVSSDISELISIFRKMIKAQAPEVSEWAASPENEEKQVELPKTRPDSRTESGRPETKTLRVGVEKIEEVMGLSGDMAINLSSFEDSTSLMHSTLGELEKTLHRLKGIASSLEAGYELATLPRLRTMSESSQSAHEGMDEFDPLEMDQYSELHILIRFLNETVVDLDSIKEQTSVFNESWRLGVERQQRILADVQNTLKAIQMTPFSTLANRLYKTVRESAKMTGKKVRLLIEGGAMEMDTRVWDIMADPLMHMLRNSVDHGVEGEDERLKAGKSKQATIRIRCSRHGNQFVLHLTDDGSGLDYDAIRNRAALLYPGLGVEQMANKDLAALIFKQGFSVKTQVTAISGRGVGLDVVRYAVDRLNGSVEVLSTSCKGVEFIFRLPITVAQFPALLVRFGQQQFAVPMLDISKVFRMRTEESLKDRFELDGDSLELLRPAEILGLEHSDRPGVKRIVSNKNPLVLAVDVGGRRGLLVTDAIVGKRDVIFKSLGSHLHNVPCVSGSTIMGDGSLVPILNAEDLFGREKLSIQGTGKDVVETGSGKQYLDILIADDSISVRKVLSNFVISQGWHPIVANDGMDAIQKIHLNKPDLILLDIEMPRMNGFEVLQSLQVQSAYRDIPVLMLTSRSAAKYRDKAAELGARGFVTKPFKDEELIALITGLTGQ